MTAKPEFLDTWNNKLVEFVRVLIKVFPDEELFQTAAAAINPILILSKDKIVKNFYKYASKYENEIRSRDEKFFMSVQPVTDDDDHHSEDGSHLLAIVDKLRALWIVMTPANRDIMWKWIEQLYTLSKIIMTGSV